MLLYMVPTLCVDDVVVVPTLCAIDVVVVPTLCGDDVDVVVVPTLYDVVVAADDAPTILC